MPETIDGQPPLPVPEICDVTLDELLSRTYRASLAADVHRYQDRTAVTDMEAAVLIKSGRPMSETRSRAGEVGAAIAKRERQQHAAKESRNRLREMGLS